MSMIAKNRIHSQWTPLSNEETNNKIFEERKDLVSKWFLKWNDDQRRKLFEELVGISKKKQLEYARDLIDSRVPCHKEDFTRYLPRAITLYIFSYLDASSLCQCAKVCWYWRYLSELDMLWMPKCLHFGWYLSFTPSPYENGVWKRNFIEQFKIIRALLPKSEGENVKENIKQAPPVPERIKLDNKKSEKKKKSGPTPWRGSDPVPKDTWRFNILNNDEVVEEVNKKRDRKVYGSATDDVVRNAKSKVNTGCNVLNSLTKSQSLSSKIEENEEKKRISSSSSTGDGQSHLADRPRWARQTPASSGGFLHKNAMKQNGILAKVTRPEPISSPPHPAKAPKSRPVTARSARDPPTSELFPQTPWKVPADDSDDAQ